MATTSPSYRLGAPFSDGYIRLTFDTFSDLEFNQKQIWEDPILLEELASDDIPARRAGYCEWSTDDLLHRVSVGWAWFGLENEQIFLAPGGISRNVMFVSPSGFDLGAHRTSELLSAWLSVESWQHIDRRLQFQAFTDLS